MDERDQASVAQWGAAGPIQIAKAYLEALLTDGDLRRVMALSHPEHRRSIVEHWLQANASHPMIRLRGASDLVRLLSDPESTDPLWNAFERSTIQGAREMFAAVDLERWGWAGDPRPEGIDRELLLFVDTDHSNIERREGRFEAVGDGSDEVPVPAIGLEMIYVDEPDIEIAAVAGDPGTPDSAEANHWRVFEIQNKLGPPPYDT